MRPFNVLFLCTGNSARSIMAEALLNRWGGVKFHAHSAGSHPKDAVHPIALELLKRMRLPTDGLRSKDWSEFTVPAAPQMDFVFTVCDQAAAETCPVWPGQPITAHWGVPDPVAVQESDKLKWSAFRDAFRMLENRVRIFANLPLASIDRLKLQAQLDDIGRLAAPAERGEDLASPP